MSFKNRLSFSIFYVLQTQNFINYNELIRENYYV
ncbi:MAG: hypothetical protein RL757_3090 [Bacteroidota bacterium]|jgi:hypothetical protein